MGPIGRRVVSIGRTRGITRGTIMAFGYEWYDEEESIYTDYLILGEGGQIFSDHGDSGKLIVTDDANRNAVALLWGGGSRNSAAATVRKTGPTPSTSTKPSANSRSRS